MVKAKNNVAKIVAFMLVLALIMSVFAFVMPKHTAIVEAATLNRQPGLYKAGTTTQTHTWAECLAKIKDGKYEDQYGWEFVISSSNADWFEGDLVLGDFTDDEISSLGRTPYAKDRKSVV